MKKEEVTPEVRRDLRTYRKVLIGALRSMRKEQVYFMVVKDIKKLNRLIGDNPHNI